MSSIFSTSLWTKSEKLFRKFPSHQKKKKICFGSQRRKGQFLFSSIMRRLHFQFSQIANADKLTTGQCSGRFHAKRNTCSGRFHAKRNTSEDNHQRGKFDETRFLLGVLWIEKYIVSWLRTVFLQRTRSKKPHQLELKDKGWGMHHNQETRKKALNQKNKELNNTTGWEKIQKIQNDQCKLLSHHASSTMVVNYLAFLLF